MCPWYSLVVSSLHLASRPFSAHLNFSGLVDPPCHAQETPHLLEGNGGVPAANSVGTVQAQQVQACGHRVNDLIWRYLERIQTKKKHPIKGEHQTAALVN